MLAVLLGLLWVLREIFNWLMNQRFPSNGGNSNLVNNQHLPQQPSPVVSSSNPLTPAPCQGNNCACNQQALSILEKMIDGNYSFTAHGNALVPKKGVYIGLKGERDILHIDNYGLEYATPPNPPITNAEETSPKTQII